ncbi:hypothetical protein [Clostridium sp. JS66]|uniref:hypothetical protein n=1 Tax=Clostridium sp. JS66 TaxID=3064705 RepID=UPI00298EA68F|nr:hypothetical protein [Clostridium sp. JS66]WPC42972.1 hypothetical protein Q6H37_05730 [Clostridium sp. JS66]
MDILHTFNYCINTPNTTDFKIETKPGVGIIGLFRYVDGLVLGSAEFEYEAKAYLAKHNKLKLLERTYGNITKDDKAKILRLEEVIMSKIDKKLLKKEDLIMYSNNYIFLHDIDKLIYKNGSKQLEKFVRFPALNKNEVKQLTKIINNNVWVNNSVLQLQTIVPKMESMAFVYKDLKNMTIPQIEVNCVIELKDLDTVKEFFINNGEKQFKNDSKDHFQLEKAEYAKELLRYDVHSINKAISKILEHDYIREIEKNETKELERYNVTFLDKVLKNKSLLRNNIMFMENNQIKKLSKYNIKNIGTLEKAKLIKKYNVYTLLKDKHYELKLYRYFIILKSLKTKLCYKINVLDMAKLAYGKGLLNDAYKYIDTLNKCKYLRTDIIKKMEKPNLKFAQFKNNINFIDKFKQYYLHKEVITPISKFSPKEVSKPDPIQMYKNVTKGLRKTDATPLFIPDIKKYFEVTGRWWVVYPEGETDEKILPYNYDYTEHPLVGSAGLGYYRVTYPDKSNYKTEIEYDQACEKMLFNIIENMKTQFYIKHKVAIPYDYLPQIYNNHPNSMSVNPYMDNDDSYRGIEEMPVAINIMMEMVNFVGNIVHHSARKFCYCTGQEAMWFIMEYLDKWLNMDSTIKELNNKGATEHYYRAYRWIRWEAEKIFFNCDYDKEKGQFRGLKYAGELLANLIEYMKNHHYNVVPIFKDISKMDYWRNQSNLDNNPQDDIVYTPDKDKEIRHYNIETKRLDKKASEGMPKTN